MTKTNKRRIATVVSLVLIVCIAVGATLAWLADKTDSVTNTFTVGKVDIEITETTPENKTAKMIPGSDIAKNPAIVLKANSEKCYVYVKIEKANNPDTYLDYTIDSGWTALGDSYPGVYWRASDAVTTDTSFAILTNNKVTVKSTLTNTEMDAAETANPTLTFTGYAIQQDNISSAVDGWTKLTAQLGG